MMNEVKPTVKTLWRLLRILDEEEEGVEGEENKKRNEGLENFEHIKSHYVNLDLFTPNLLYCEIGPPRSLSVCFRIPTILSLHSVQDTQSFSTFIDPYIPPTGFDIVECFYGFSTVFSLHKAYK
ncbi:hypothetical protein RRG08_014151 [Elysia crispata]|uniref:Uncharacterized protein n=1 Tax=Elysia crispata TaxID=231223 RepID=A0AAE1AGI1_9GAST|nr:hypothetical protein RRG08_014151 [Elysia crispata]